MTGVYGMTMSMSINVINIYVEYSEQTGYVLLKPANREKWRRLIEKKIKQHHFTSLILCDINSQVFPIHETETTSISNIQNHPGPSNQMRLTE